MLWTEKPKMFQANKMRFSRSQQSSEGMYLKKERERKEKGIRVPALEAEGSIFH